MPDTCITDYVSLFRPSFVSTACVPWEGKHVSAISRAVAAPSPGADDVSSGTPQCKMGAASFLLEDHTSQKRS